MPFTFSHPALVLPLLALPKKWRSATGLILGSLTPDFEKFLRMSEFDPYSHTWRSIFYFNLPLGLLLAFAFHGVVRDTLIRHLPQFLRERFARFVGFDWKAYFRRHYATVIFSLLIGTVSHLVWDSFTHPEGRGVRLFPFLDHQTLAGLLHMKRYSFLQKTGSVLGALAVAYYLLRLPQSAPRLGRGNSALFWSLVMFVSLGIIVLRLQLDSGIRLENLYHLTIILISAAMTSLVLSPILLRTGKALWLKSRRGKQNRPRHIARVKG
jgi:hypothetical protein